MTDRAQAVLREAMALPSDERATVAAELLASLDDPAEDPTAVRAAWAEEIERRGRRALAGESSGELWEVVRGRVTRRLTNQRTPPQLNG